MGSITFYVDISTREVDTMAVPKSDCYTDSLSYTNALVGLL